MKLLLTILLYILSSLYCLAQTHAVNWYFASSGISFLTNPPQVLNNSSMNAFETASTISDSSGNLLFYTDGMSIWDRNHQIMKNGEGLRGNKSTTQGAIIIPVLNHPHLFYLFTVTAQNIPSGDLCENCAYYSIIDINRNNGLGEVISKNNLLVEAKQVSEKLTATLDCTGKGYWILLHHETENIFYAYNVSSEKGIIGPVVSKEGIDISQFVSFGFLWGQMKISPNGKKIIQANVGLELFDFNNTTGKVTNSIQLSEGLTYNEYYGVSFSPDNRKVYFDGGRTNDQNFRELIQLSIDLPSKNDILNTKQIIARIDPGPTSLQLTPHKKIFIKKLFSNHVSVIEAPNEFGALSEYKSNVLILNEPSVGNFPNFPDSYFHQGPRILTCVPPIAGFIIDTICAGNTIQYRDTSHNLPNEWYWTFEGGQPSEFKGEVPPTIYYKEAGSFKTTLIVKNSYGENTLTQTVLVLPRPIADAGNDITLCGSATAQLGIEAITGNTYLWTPSAGLDNPNVAQPRVTPIAPFQKYFLKVTNEWGCENIDSIVVSIGEIKAIARDTSFCRGSSVVVKASGGSEYEWNPSTGLSATTGASVIASPSETTTYRVIASSGECRDTAFLKVEVLDTPTANAGSDKEICAGESVELGAVSNEPGLTYTWSPVEGLLKTDIANPTATVLKTTEYILTVTNEAGCALSDTVLVTVNNSVSVTASADTSICAGSSIQLSAASEENVLFKWTPQTGLDNADISNPVATPKETTTYIVTAFKNGGLCTEVDSVTITVLNAPQITTQDIRLCEGESGELWAESDDENLTWRWTPTTGLNDPTIQNPTVTAFKSETYFVTATNAARCSATKELRVTVQEKAVVSAVIKTEKAELEPGEAVNVHLLLKTENIAATSFKAVIHFDEKVFLYTPESARFLNNVDNTWFLKGEIVARGELQLTATGQTPIAASDIAFELTAYLAKQTDENIAVKLIELNGEVVKEGECSLITKENTKVLLKEVCAGDMRLVNVGEFQTYLSNIHPNPLRETITELVYSIGIEGKIKLEIYNIQGILLKCLFDGIQKQGVFKETLNVTDFPDGLYYCKLTTSQATHLKNFIIGRK